LEYKIYFCKRSGYSKTKHEEDINFYDLKDLKRAQEKTNKIIKKIKNEKYFWTQDDVNFRLVLE